MEILIICLDLKIYNYKILKKINRGLLIKMKVYITNANSKRIINLIDKKRISEIAGEIYEKPFYFLSKAEKQELLILKKLFEGDDDDFIRYCYKKIDKYIDPLKWVYIDNRPPSYHLNKECNWVSNFSNYEIPEPIREQGVEKAEEYRKWFFDNKNLIDYNKIDIFLSRLNMTFNLSYQSIGAVMYDNSGVDEIYNYDLTKVKQQINLIIKKAGEYYHKSKFNTDVYSQ